MKILMVTESYWPNADGGALFERRLAQSMAAKGHELLIWAPGASAKRHWQHDGLTRIRREGAVTFLFNKKYKVSYWPWLEGRRLLRSMNPDIVHVHNPYWLGLSTVMWARIYRIPIVATNHFMPENALLNLRTWRWLYNPLHSIIWKYLVWFHNRCKLVTSPTPTAVKLLVTNGLVSSARPISNGVDTEVFKPGQMTTQLRKRLKLPNGRPIMLYVGRLDGEKRLDVIVDSMKLIKNGGSNALLVIAGYGTEMARLKSQVAKMRLTDDVVFTGYIEEDDKPILYSTAALFVIASPAELQSIVTLEAMACGLPILAVDVAALSELCHDGSNGYLFAPSNSRDLADKAMQLLSSPALAGQFGLESRRIVESQHSTRVTVDLYEKAYTDTIGLTQKKAKQ